MSEYNYEQLAKLAGCTSRSIRRWIAAEKMAPPPFTYADIAIACELAAAYKVQQTANLKSHSAPDTEGGTVTVGCKLSVDDAAFFKSLEGGASYHMRQAAKMYRQHLESGG